ncbi:MAG: hypothetical protein ACT443_10545 [Gemmatimonadota bacterium]
MPILQVAAAVAVAFAFAASQAAAQTIQVTTTPNSARIYSISDQGVWALLGTGSARVKLDKKSSNRFRLVAEGYDTVDPGLAAFLGKKQKTLHYTMKTRLVKLTVLPYDAQVLRNGERYGNGASIPVNLGETVTLEVKKAGFKTEKRTYRFEESGETPPLTERIELKDRLVSIQPLLPLNTEARRPPITVSADGTEVGTGNVDVVVPADKCVTVSIASSGYKPEIRNLCNKDEKKLEDALEVALMDRLVTINATPKTASIFVGNDQVGKGTYNLVVKNGACVEVRVLERGYGRDYRRFCNRENTPLETEVPIDLPFDQAYSSSVQSDQANVNFTIEVGSGKTADQAWRIISQVVLGQFDVIEITDKETGYLRTAWQTAPFTTNTIRTRVIVKLGDSNPLKYVVKIASEQSGFPKTSVKDDEAFEEWDRVLNSYKDIINELQARLR